MSQTLPLVRTPLAVLRDASSSLGSLTALFARIELLAAHDRDTAELAKIGSRITDDAIAAGKDQVCESDSTDMSDAVSQAHRGLLIAQPVLRAIELGADLDIAVLARTGSVIASATLSDPANGWLTI